MGHNLITIRNLCRRFHTCFPFGRCCCWREWRVNPNDWPSVRLFYYLYILRLDPFPNINRPISAPSSSINPIQLVRWRFPLFSPQFSWLLNTIQHLILSHLLSSPVSCSVVRDSPKQDRNVYTTSIWYSNLVKSPWRPISLLLLLYFRFSDNQIGGQYISCIVRRRGQSNESPAGSLMSSAMIYVQWTNEPPPLPIIDSRRGDCTWARDTLLEPKPIADWSSVR